MLPETVSFDKEGRVEHSPVMRRVFLPLFIILVGGLCFGLGRLSRESREPVKIIMPDSNAPQTPITSNPGPQTSAQAPKPTLTPTQTAAAIVAPPVSNPQVYASVNGKRYYYMNCKSTVSEKNKVTFATPAMAESAGYTLATGCKP